LVVILLDEFGTEALTWSAETIRLELEDSFNVKLPPNNVDKLMAGTNLLTSDDFYKRPQCFIQICNILSDDDFDPTVFDPADSSEMAWGITEALLLYPPDEDEPFSNEIRHYVGRVLAEEGITSPPDVLKIALQDVSLTDPGFVSADDPEMYEAYFSLQSRKSAEVTEMLQRQIQELMSQLQSLVLLSGDVKDLLNRLKGGITRE